jgi:hypothetical protein
MHMCVYACVRTCVRIYEFLTVIFCVNRPMLWNILTRDLYAQSRLHLLASCCRFACSYVVWFPELAGRCNGLVCLAPPDKATEWAPISRGQNTALYRPTPAVFLSLMPSHIKSLPPVTNLL